MIEPPGRWPYGIDPEIWINTSSQCSVFRECYCFLKVFLYQRTKTGSRLAFDLQEFSETFWKFLSLCDEPKRPFAMVRPSWASDNGGPAGPPGWFAGPEVIR
jgi:hypothetical protein